MAGLGTKPSAELRVDVGERSGVLDRKGANTSERSVSSSAAHPTEAVEI